MKLSLETNFNFFKSIFLFHWIFRMKNDFLFLINLIIINTFFKKINVNFLTWGIKSLLYYRNGFSEYRVSVPSLALVNITKCNA